MFAATTMAHLHLNHTLIRLISYLLDVWCLVTQLKVLAPGSNNLLQRTSVEMGISDSAIPPSKRSFIHSQEEELSFDASSPPDDQTPHHPHETISSVSAKTMQSPHLPLGELMIKKPRREVPTGTPITQFRDARKNAITQLSLEDLDRISTPVQISVPVLHRL